MSEELNPQDVFGLLRSYSRHRDYVRAALSRVVDELNQRAIVHDASKMMDDEFAGFSRINAAARINKFGSPEYKDGMKRERSTIDLHFSRNSHHPERPSLIAGIENEPDDHRYFKAKAEADMTFLDVIEMVCDWWGARKGYDDPRSWADTVKLNFESKGQYLSSEQRWLAEQVATFLEAYA